MPSLGLETHIVDEGVYANTLDRFRQEKILLPTFAQLADPHSIDASIRERLSSVDPDSADPLNLFRVHWYMDADRRSFNELPGHWVLPPELTGIDAKIVVLLGERFPMIHAHKVLAAYGCLAPRIITGQFDPTQHRAIWPSTGNYCRGGVAISRILGCRGVAVLPEGMSSERFHWLEQWATSSDDIIRTPGTESNVKEIYDECNELDRDENNIIFHQFSEFGNDLVHYACTGRALAHVFEHLLDQRDGLKLRAFVSATGSGGTLAAAYYLKDHHGSLTVAVEALECPTLLYNGFGEHNIQGIGDKHVPLIHNVMATDVVLAVSDNATDRLHATFNSDAGHDYLRRRGLEDADLARLSSFGLSSLCNILAAIKTAKYYRMGENDVIMTVATDPASMYETETEKILVRDFAGAMDEVAAAETFGRYMLAASTDDLLECNLRDRERIFDLGYYTWVEQQGISVDDFTARREASFWIGLRQRLSQWDAMIEQFNQRTGVATQL